MTTADLRRLQSAVAEGRYDLTQHAVEELADDDLDILDLEAAVAAAILLRVQTDDARGARYTVAGPSVDGQRRVGVVGRFADAGRFVVITVFQALKREE